MKYMFITNVEYQLLDRPIIEILDMPPLDAYTFTNEKGLQGVSTTEALSKQTIKAQHFVNRLEGLDIWVGCHPRVADALRIQVECWGIMNEEINKLSSDCYKLRIKNRKLKTTKRNNDFWTIFNQYVEEVFTNLNHQIDAMPGVQ